jgi:hypothetical protein
MHRELLALLRDKLQRLKKKCPTCYATIELELAKLEKKECNH